jgi:hypothetical protein
VSCHGPIVAGPLWWHGRREHLDHPHRSSQARSAPARRLPLTTLAALGLLAVTAVWGSTFFLLKDVVQRVPVTDFLAVRFAIAAVAVWLIAPRSLSRLTAVERRNGVLLGLVVRRRAGAADGRPAVDVGLGVGLRDRHVRRRSPRCSGRSCCRRASAARSGPPSRWPRRPRVLSLQGLALAPARR